MSQWPRYANSARPLAISRQRALRSLWKRVRYCSGSAIWTSRRTAYTSQPSHTERHRHTRKYAEGELPPDRSFYFRGPQGKLHLRAQNLMLFLQMADGVDDETWMYHLRKGDYSHWFREMIKDDELAGEAETIEKLPNISPADSRKLIKAAVEKRYTQPAASPLPMPGTDAAAERMAR